jgi:membrane associated rhomboid family serine protease
MDQMTKTSRFKGTLRLLGISIVLQVLITIWPNLENYLGFDVTKWWAPISFWTAMVTHGGWHHLIGNYLFGLPAMMWLEAKYGMRRMLDIFFKTAAFGALLDLIMVGMPSIGSSGAMMGCVSAACMMIGRNKIEQMLGFIAVVLLLIPNIESAWLEALMGIGFWCHIGGALMGLYIACHRHKNA